MNTNLIEIRKNRRVSVYTNFSTNSERDQSRKTIFFIHGSMATCTQFSDIIDGFKNDYDIVAFDALGCGNSEKPSEYGMYSPDNLLADLCSIFEKYASLQNIVVGHSFGTVQAIRLYNSLMSPSESAKHTKICKIVLLGSALSIDAKSFLWSLPVFCLDILHPMLTAGFADRAFSPATSAQLREKCLATSKRNDMFVCKAFYSQFSWCSKSEWIKHCIGNDGGVLENIDRVPILIIAGDDDNLVPATQSLELYEFLKNVHVSKEDVPLYHRIVKGAGHQMIQEKPSDVIELMKTFLDKELSVIDIGDIDVGTK